jgi:hypothetical protein
MERQRVGLLGHSLMYTVPQPHNGLLRVLSQDQERLLPQPQLHNDMAQSKKGGKSKAKGRGK